MRSFLERFWSHVEVRSEDECWLWNGARLRSGYGHVQLRSLSTTAHRVMLEIATGIELKSNEHSAHHCDNPPCCNPSHLFRATGSENQHDAIRKGRWAHIDKSRGNPVLTLDQVNEIRKSLCGLPRTRGPISPRAQKYRELSKKYEISVRAIYKIDHGITWNNRKRHTEEENTQ